MRFALTAAIALVAVGLLVAWWTKDDAEDHAQPPGPSAAQSRAIPIAVWESGKRDSCRPLQYSGRGDPDVVIGLNVTFQPSWPGAESLNAVRLLLEERDWQAGPFRVALLVCESSVGYLSISCGQNGEAFQRSAGLVGVIAPATSGCAAQQIPLASHPDFEPVALVSGTNSYACLTRRATSCKESEPDQYYPSGERTYWRISPSELAEGAALAQLARERGLRRIAVLPDKEAYGLGMAIAFRAAARSLGLSVVHFEHWDPHAKAYRTLMERIRRKRPDALLLAGLISENGGPVIRDKVTVLGPNRGRVKLLAPEGFRTRQTVREAGSAAEGMLVTSGSIALRFLPARGRALARAVKSRVATNPTARDLERAIYAAQAAEVILEAIARSDGSRGDVLAKIPDTRIEAGLIGKVAFDSYGDATFPGITVYRVRNGRFRPEEVVEPDAALVDIAAAG